MGSRLKGKVAVVTGAGRGIGREEALALAAEGAKVLVNDLGVDIDGSGQSHAPAEKVVEEIIQIGGEAVSNFDTVATREGGENIIKTAIDAFGRIDILVNNAAIARDRMIFNMTEEEWDAVIKVCLYGHYFCSKPACIHFRQQKSGRIINTSSLAGLGNVGQSNYGAAKEGILGFTKSLALDMAKYGVTCNSICPGAGTRLTMRNNIWQAWEKSKEKGLPLPNEDIMKPEELKKRTPEMIAPMVVFLATDEAANINGKNFSIIGNEIGIFSDRDIISRIYTENKWTIDELVEIVPKTLAKI